MITSPEGATAKDIEWQQMKDRLSNSTTLASLVLIAWQMGLWLARSILEYELHKRSHQPQDWGYCSHCGERLHSKGFVRRQMLTLVGSVSWERRVGRCPNRCVGSHQIPFDGILGLEPYQQTSVELMRLGCLLAVFLPFELAVVLLQQLSGIRISDATLWQWVQGVGQQAMEQLQEQLEAWQRGDKPQPETLAPEVAALPLLIGADGVTVPFRPTPGSAGGKIVYYEVKVALLARLGQRLSRRGEQLTQLVHRRLVAVLGDIDALQHRLEFQAYCQGIDSAPQVVWLSDGARGFWRLFRESFAHLAVGILDFYHATQHLWHAAQAYGHTLPHRSPQQWFERLRHQLRRGYVHRIIKEFTALLRYPSTPPTAQEEIAQVRQYLLTHQEHLRYRQFKKQGFPIGSGMVESACKWLITQRFKGVGMRWSKDGFNHLLHLRLAWVNQCFDPLFADQALAPKLYSPNQ
jgi:hypothetical protein